jgi:uncharacterized membrane protein HdeD (DUF308 family)
MIAGILVVAFGIIVVIRGLDYGSQRSEIRVGDYSASVQSRRSVPLWVGGAALVGGVLLLGAALRRRSRDA